VSEDEPVDPEAFWRLGPLPGPVDDPTPPALTVLGRPEISVDGRNLFDVLRPVYDILTRPDPD